MVRIDRKELKGQDPCQGAKEKNRRQTREEGVKGGYQFKDWGSRRILILAVVRKGPETAYNLDLIINMVGLDQIRITLTGDFAFLLP